MSLAALLEEIGSNRQGHISTIRRFINHHARDHDGPVVLCMSVRWAHVSGRHFDKCAVRAVSKIAIRWRGSQFTVHAIREAGQAVLKFCNWPADRGNLCLHVTLLKVDLI